MTATKRTAVVLAMATAIAIPAESIRLRAYRDPIGLPTICMGSTKGVRMGDVKTLPECRELLNREMLDVIEQVERCAPGLPPPSLAAFADAAYNIGPKIVCDTRQSTIARLLKEGNVRHACERLPDWSKARVAGVLVPLPGLVKRRALERDLCLEGLT